MNDNFRKIPKIISYKNIYLISDGISNLNYRIVSDNESTSDQLLTIYPNKQDWWKADKEESITKLYKEKEISSIRLLGTGYIRYKNHNSRYLLREYVKEKDFDMFLNEKPSLLPKEWVTLLMQWGDKMGKLHSIPMNGYGLLRKNKITGSDTGDVPAASNWQKYIDNLMLNREKISKQIDKKNKYGTITGLDIQNIFESSYSFYKKHRSALLSVKESYLIHYDMLLKNIIINYNNHLSLWEISAIIDNEWVSAGDPDIDLIQIENSIFFNTQKETIANYWKFFTKSYSKNKRFSKDIDKKRLIYHMMRSLFYLMEVFRFDRPKVVSIDERSIQNIEANYLFLQQLIHSEKVGFSLFEHF